MLDGEPRVIVNSTPLILLGIAARRTARFLGIPVTGTLGVLVKAKSEGVITEVGQALDELRANGFFVRDAVAQRILELAGER